MNNLPFYYKQAGVASEVTGTLLNPFNTLSGTLGTTGGALAAAATKTRTDEEQEKADKKMLSNLLVPGVAPYNLFKRYGHSKAHERKEKEERKHHNKEKKAMNTQEAYIQGFVKRANEYGFNDRGAIELLKQAAPGWLEKLQNFSVGNTAPAVKPPTPPPAAAAPANQTPSLMQRIHEGLTGGNQFEQKGYGQNATKNYYKPAN
jgi:delta 1-pyrroline-5-carboxylate dehydrogenase